MICSVLIPSRGRPERLRQAIRSIRETSRSENVEILLRLDGDDASTLATVDDLAREHDFRATIGPRRLGYPSIGEFYAELASVAQGTWIWIMNDDAYVTGPPSGSETSWDVQLAAVPISGVIVQPECYQLGHSKYWSSPGGAFPLVPNGCWSALGKAFNGGSAIDTWLDQLLRARNGWRTQFLAGIAAVHERDTEDVLAKHREI